MTTTNAMNAKEASMEAYWKDDFLPLQTAGKAILRELREDEAGGDLHRRILSGGSHLYFPSTTNSEFAHEQSLPLPPHLQNEANSVRYSLQMGLLPEANLAWMSVDDKLFLWSFEDQENFLDLKMASGQCIVSVGIAPPKKDIFTKVVEWCLVVSTPDEVMLCAVARQNDRLHLVPTRYTVPTDSIPILSICGLPNGRIFMGGHDGSLYEFAYENLVAKSASPPPKTMDQRLADYYDGTANSVKVQNQLPGVVSKVVTGGKRAFSAMWSGGSGGNGPAKRCRMLNHSATGFSAAASSVVPEWLLKAPVAIFGAGKGSALQKIVHDPERQCLYTLTARGCVGVYDLRSKELILKATIDCDKISRLYLSAVAKGHMYSPSSNIEFAGGGSAAQAGVGGMDGARSILKLAESNGEKAKLLAPVSLHVIPRTDSSRLTLLAVTSGGLRYYLSSLSQSSLNKSNLAPSSRIIMCHIRSPPPVDPETGRFKESFDEGDVPGGMVPRLLPNTLVDASSYSDGHLFLALQRPPQQAPNGSQVKEVGNIIVGTNADFVARKVTKKENNLNIRELPGGVAETVSLPTSLLPGGRIVAASSIGAVRKSTLMKLMMNSHTPSDSELSVGLVPPYYPKIAEKEASKKEQEKKKQFSTSSFDAASTALVSTNKVKKPSQNAIAMRVMWNFMLSRPLGHGIAFQAALPTSNGVGGTSSQPQVYRISNRYGSDGFSSTAGNIKGSSSVAMVRSSNHSHTSVRLSPWLLRPAMVPLSEMAINHIMSSTKTVAISAGGLHYFSSRTILAALTKTLEVSGHDIAQDKGVVAFFNNYGYKEACTLCLMLAIGSGPAKGNGAEDVKTKALHAAFGRGGAPRLDRKEAFEDGRDPYVVSEVAADPLVPAGYDFVPSYLSESVMSLSSRLLRPIWYKPAVVVTEGQTTKPAGSVSKRLPAKVELLLDDTTLEEVRTPLYALKQAIQECFRPAIENVPGIRKKDSNEMDVDETQVLTGFMRFQGATTPRGASTGFISKDEALSIARLVEERNLHSLYRLVTRSVQLLDLLSILKRAQHMFDLPEVDWGLLHGLTISQLVESCDGQERIENLLNSLVSNTKAVNGATVTPTADSDQLAKSLATQCYLFFSPGSRFSYLGFRAANEALGCMELSSRRRALSQQAISHFKMAASFWTSAQLITGRLMHSGEAESYEQKVTSALQYNSPLAMASSILMEIGEVVAIVDICTTTAANFAGATAVKQLTSGEQIGFPWERTLYHDRKVNDVAAKDSNDISSTDSSSKAIVVVASVTGQDAISTCHAIMLHHLLILLKKPGLDEAKRMMVSACAASSDKQFLKALFDFLLKTGHESTLLKIDSIDLERWLDEKKDAQLMWQYYMIQRKHTKAGKLMMQCATDEHPVVALDERIVFLERSQSAYNSALLAAQNQVNPPDVDTQELENQRVLASDSLDVARLQQQTLKKITSLGLESQVGEEKLQKLKMTLLVVNVLYNDYAASVHLFDICLRILHSCRHNHPETIELLWKSLICQEILPCATRSEATFNFLNSLMSESLIKESLVLVSPTTEESDNLPMFESGTWLEPLKQTVETLGSELCGTSADYVCPVELLVTSLEGLRHALQVNPSAPWPLQIISSIGVSYPDLLDAYEGMVDGESRSIMGGASPIRLYLSLKSVVELFEEWVLVASNGEYQNRAYRELSNAVVSNRLMSQIDEFKAGLRDLVNNGGGDEVQMVANRLHRVEDTIGRMS